MKESNVDRINREVQVERQRRLSRYDEAIRLLRECTEFAGKEQLPGLDWIDVQIDKDAFAEALTFLAAEPKKGPEKHEEKGSE